MKPSLLSGGACVLLLALAGCGGGGGGTAPAASGGSLAYVDPPQTQGQFALVRDAASTPGLLVLDLVGPAGTAAVGVTFGFDVASAGAAWSTAPAVVTNGSVFVPATGSQVVQGWVNAGRLQGIVSNKGLAAQVADIGGVIGQIRLTPAPGGAAGPVGLADNGLGSLLDASGTPRPVRVQVGTLTRD